VLKKFNKTVSKLLKRKLKSPEWLLDNFSSVCGFSVLTRLRRFVVSDVRACSWSVGFERTCMLVVRGV
jgi:hypothetical protein